MCAINDPLGQTHSPASSDHLKFVLFWEILTDVHTPFVEIVITTGRDYGSASWINSRMTSILTNRLTVLSNYTET